MLPPDLPRNKDFATNKQTLQMSLMTNDFHERERERERESVFTYGKGGSGFAISNH